VGRLVAVTGWAVVLVGCPGGGPQPAPEPSATLGAGDPFAAVALSGHRPALVWVFHIEHCLGCKLGDAARVVRGLQRGLGEGLEIVAVAIGDGGEGDREIVRGFMASQRVTARVEVHSRRRYLQGFGAAQLPVLYVINRNTVVEAAVAADSMETWRSPGDRLDLAGFVARLAGKSVERSGEGSGMQ